MPRIKYKWTPEQIQSIMETNAKRFGHHGAANLVETAKQKDGITITLEQAQAFIDMVN